MIDSVIRVVDSGPSNRSGVKARRYLLLEVEGVRQDNVQRSIFFCPCRHIITYMDFSVFSTF
jgi:hypothetical protein